MPTSPRTHARKVLYEAFDLVLAAPTAGRVETLQVAAIAYRATFEPIDADARAMVSRARQRVRYLQGRTSTHKPQRKETP